MTADVRADEGAHRNDLQPSRAQIVEGAADELGAEALAPRLDLRVHEREPARNAPVADLAGGLAVVVQLVAQLLRVVRDPQHRQITLVLSSRVTSPLGLRRLG